MIKNRIFEKLNGLIKNGFFHIFFGNTFIKLISFISSIAIVRLVTKQDYAYLAYSNNLYAYINLFSGLGLSTALLKYSSDSESKEVRKAYLRITLIAGSAFQLIATLFLLFVVSLVDLPFEEAKGIVYISIFIPLFTHFVTTVQIYNRSQLQNRRYSKMAVSQSFLTFILSIVFVLIIGIKGTIFAQYVAMLFSIYIGFSFVYSDLKNVKTIKLTKCDIKPFIFMGLSLMVANFFSMVMQYNEMFLVNNLIRDEVATANYKVALLIPSHIGIITGSIVVYFFPIIAKVKNMKKVWLQSVKVGLLTFGIITTVTIIGVILTPMIIKYVYGEMYADAIELSYIFWIVYSINAGFRMIPLNILPAIGKVKMNSYISVGSALCHGLLSYYFINSRGIMGAAYAIGIIYIVSGLFYWVYLYKVCHTKQSEDNYGRN